jgi:hypothetical protein
LYLVRWFWWRVNAWCEIVAMVSSFLASVALLMLARSGTAFSTHAALVITVIVTTVCWVTTAYVAPQTDRAVLIAFYRKVRPFGPGWAAIRKEAGARIEPVAVGENIPMALLGWVAGCTAIWSSLFAVGNYLYGRWDYAILLTVIFAISGFVLIRIVNKLWVGAGAEMVSETRSRA